MNNLKTYFIIYAIFLPIVLFSKTNSSLEAKSNYLTYIAQRDTNITIPIKKGDFTSIPFDGNSDDIKWAKHFNIVELGGIYDDITSQKMIKKGFNTIKYHIGYDWMPAFYYYISGENRKFVKWIYENKDKTTLNPNGPFIHCKENGYEWCREYYYDYANQIMFNKRVDDLIENIHTKGFNGVFFDWASGGFILSKEYKQMKELFKKRHPHKNYFKSVAKFYKTLKDRGIFIVTNQAFRKEEYGLLKYVDYDMTESYITTDINKKINLQLLGKGWVDSIKVTNYYPIYDDSKSLKDSLYFIDLLTSYKKRYKKYGFKNFIYLNYIAPDYEKVYASTDLYREKKPKNAIYFSYAMGKLTNNIVYTELSDDRTLERDSVYFYDLGKVLGKKYTHLKTPKNSYVRFYTNGFVLVSDTKKKSLYLKLTSDFIPKNAKIYDAYNKLWLQSKKNSLIIKLNYKKDIFSKQYLPLGRVFLYSR